MNLLEIGLTWTLIHSLWVAFAIWLVVSGIAAFLKSSQQKRALKVAGMGAFALSMIAVFIYQVLPGASTPDTILPVAEEAIGESTSISLLAQRIDSSVNLGSEIIPQIWMLGLVYGIIRLIYSRKSLMRYRKSAIPCFDEQINQVFARVSRELDIKRRAYVLISPLVNSPMTTGVLKPLVYLPAGMISGFSTDEMEAIFMHELLHIKRNDYLVNILLMSLETVFFFNPVVLLMAKDLRKEMEFACDDSVLQRVDKLKYAKVLLRLQVSNIHQQVGMAAKSNTGEFKERIDRIVGQASKKTVSLYGALPLILLCTLLFASAFGFKKSAEPTHDKANLIETILPETPQSQEQEQEQDTTEIVELLWQDDNDTITYEDKKFVWLMEKEKPKSLKVKRHILESLDQEIIRIISGAPLRKSDKMMEEIQEELVKDGLLHEGRTKITLMFQYSDILNGPASLGNYYEKYKSIFNRYFPRYDSFATTRNFRYKSPVS